MALSSVCSPLKKFSVVFVHTHVMLVAVVVFASPFPRVIVDTLKERGSNRRIIPAIIVLVFISYFIVADIFLCSVASGGSVVAHGSDIGWRDLLAVIHDLRRSRQMRDFDDVRNRYEGAILSICRSEWFIRFVRSRKS